MMWGKRAGLAAALLCATATAGAGDSFQGFSQAVFFGDSNTDSGYYLYQRNGSVFAPPGAGTYTTNPDPGYAVALGQLLGFSVTPSDAPGGGNNYAAGGARVSSNAGTPATALSATQQVNAYLSSNNGRANPNALFVLFIGTNDLKGTSIPNIVTSPTPNFPEIAALGQRAANLIIALNAAGGRYFVVPNTEAIAFNTGASGTAARTAYDQAVWNGIRAAGVNFIPADFNVVSGYVFNNPAPFGITVTSINSPACTVPSFRCLPANYVSPDAGSTHFFADTDGHFGGAVQKILADYLYSLIVAPSQISFLPEVSVKTRLNLVATIQNQIDISQRQRGPQGYNAWISGDVSSLKIDNFPNFPNDPGTPAALTAGFDFKAQNSVVVGAAFSAGTTKQSFDLGGSFRQNEYSASLYAAWRSDLGWANAIVSYGGLDYDVRRHTPIGITSYDNRGKTQGTDLSFATTAGWDFKAGILTHGPLAGIIGQRVHVDGFSEVGGNFTSLVFGEQTRNSAVTALGYRASVNWGGYRPFVQMTWNHELLSSADRQVTASLTTVTAPSYSLPAINLGKDWGTGTVGITAKWSHGVTALAAFVGQIGQNGVATYGGQVGLNYAF